MLFFSQVHVFVIRSALTCDEIWMGVFRKAGVPTKRARVLLNLSLSLNLNLVRGIALNRIWRHDDTHYRAYLKEWISIVNQQLQALK